MQKSDKRRLICRGVVFSLLSLGPFFNANVLAQDAAPNAPAIRGDSHAPTDLERFERQLERIHRESRLQIDPTAPAGQRALVKYGGFATAGYLSADDIDNDTHVLRQYELVGYARLNLDGVHDFFFRGRTGYQDFHRGDRFDAELEGDDENDDFIDPEVERLFYRFDLRRHLARAEGREPGYNVSVQAGRDLVYWGNGVVLSRVLDGVTVDLELGGGSRDTVNASDAAAALRLLAGVTARDTVDFDASRPDFENDTVRGFYGALLGVRQGSHRPFLYVLAQEDYNEQEPVAFNIPFVGPTRATFGYDSYYVGLGSNGAIGDRLAYGVELVYEGGESRTNAFAFNEGGELLTQRHEDIKAFALDARLDYLLDDAGQTRFSSELILASGDRDRGHTSNTIPGNRPGTDDRAFNAFGLLNTGLAFNPEVSNMALARVGVSTFPAPQVRALRRLQVGADLFLYHKLDPEAPIDEPTSNQRYLGFEPDLFLNWRITSDVTLAVRYGVFFPGRAILSGDDEERQFFFAGLTFAF